MLEECNRDKEKTGCTCMNVFTMFLPQCDALSSKQYKNLYLEQIQGRPCDVS